MAVLTPFHVAIPVRDIAEARRFYGEQMGLPEGRSAPTWIDFNLFGHQFVVHLDPMIGQDGRVRHHFNPVDGRGIPVPHYGVVLRVPDWEELEKRVRTFVTEFVVEPYTRFAGMPGEQKTMFFLDPTGNALEFKAFADIDKSLFAV